MPALNYSDQFAPLVASGEKRQTIRALRKRPFVQGECLTHYHRQRHPDCLRLGFSVAEQVLDIDIMAQCDGTGPAVFLQDAPGAGQRRLGHQEVCGLAKADGFKQVSDFYDWFVAPPVRGVRQAKDYHFFGQLIKWPTTWQPAACPNCHDTLEHVAGGLLWCSSCDHRLQLEAAS